MQASALANQHAVLPVSRRQGYGVRAGHGWVGGISFRPSWMVLGWRHTLGGSHGHDRTVGIGGAAEHAAEPSDQGTYRRCWMRCVTLWSCALALALGRTCSPRYAFTSRASRLCSFTLLSISLHHPISHLDKMARKFFIGYVSLAYTVVAARPALRPWSLERTQRCGPLLCTSALARQQRSSDPRRSTLQICPFMTNSAAVTLR